MDFWLLTILTLQKNVSTGKDVYCVHWNCHLMALIILTYMKDFNFVSSEILIQKCIKQNKTDKSCVKPMANTTFTVFLTIFGFNSSTCHQSENIFSCQRIDWTSCSLFCITRTCPVTNTWHNTYMS